MTSSSASRRPPLIWIPHRRSSCAPASRPSTFASTPMASPVRSAASSSARMSCAARTAEQIRNLLALPYLPDSLVIVEVPAGTCMLIGTAAPILGHFPANPPAIPTPGPWGRGGVPQEKLLGISSAPGCANPQFVPSGDYVNLQPIGQQALSYRPRAGGGNAGAVAAALDTATPPPLFTDMDGVYNSLDLLEHRQCRTPAIRADAAGRRGLCRFLHGRDRRRRHVPRHAAQPDVARPDERRCLAQCRHRRGPARYRIGDAAGPRRLSPGVDRRLRGRRQCRRQWRQPRRRL